MSRLADAEILALHRELVATPSVSGAERAVADRLAALLAAHGVTPWRVGDTLVALAGEGPLLLLDTHLDASGTDVYRRQEAAHVVALLDSLRRTGAPVLAGGDFNSTPESAPVALLLAAGMRDGWVACGGAGAGLTFPAALQEAAANA